MSNGPVPECFGDLCSYGVLGNSICGPGTGDCGLGRIVRAAPSNSHNQPLIDASIQIHQILSNIPPDPDGRELAFINTRQGMMLVWVEHSDTVPPGRITVNNGTEEIAAALNIVPWDDPPQMS